MNDYYGNDNIQDGYQQETGSSSSVYTYIPTEPIEPNSIKKPEKKKKKGGGFFKKLGVFLLCGVLFGYGGYGNREMSGSGSGIIVGQNETELLVLTNYHVIDGADSLTVTFTDGNTAEAQVKGPAEDNDLAVIAIPLESMNADTLGAIKIATLGDSNALRVGDEVIAIGNALGYGQSLTYGHVSALSR